MKKHFETSILRTALLALVLAPMPALAQEAARPDRHDLRAIMFGLAGLLCCVGTRGRSWRWHSAACDMLFLGLGRLFRFCWRFFGLCRRFATLGLLRLGFHGRRPRFQTQPVRLADHGIAADTAKFLGDLAGGQAFFPHFLECIDPFVGPRHKSITFS